MCRRTLWQQFNGVYLHGLASVINDGDDVLFVENLDVLVVIPVVLGLLALGGWFPVSAEIAM